jgi:hypothetical protein
LSLECSLYFTFFACRSVVFADFELDDMGGKDPRLGLGVPTTTAKLVKSSKAGKSHATMSTTKNAWPS